MRINLISSSGSGKSTVAAGLYAYLKKSGFEVELVREVIKDWAYECRFPQEYDQLMIFASQLHAEDKMLRYGIPNIITDSPLFMQCFYAKNYKFPCWKQLFQIAKKFEKNHPSFNIWLDRTGVPFNPNGRYEKKREEAEKLDGLMMDFMGEVLDNMVVYKTVETEKWFAKIAQNLLSLE